MIEVKEESGVVFPIVKKHKQDGFLVLFVEEKTGAVIKNGTSSYPDGFFSDTWASCFSKYWVDFHGEIIIKQ